MTPREDGGKRRILVTGADGFIGREVVAELSRKGHAVRGIGSADGIDVSDRQAISRLMAEEAPEAIIHLAAVSGAMLFPNNPDIVTSVNAVGTVNVFETARLSGTRRIVYASSVAVIETDPESESAPRSLYGATKQFGETVATLYREKYHLESVSVRIGSVYGARRRTEDVLNRMVSQGRLTGTIRYDPRAVEPLVEVRDVARTLASLATVDHPRAVYDLVAYAASHEQIARELAAGIGCRTEPEDPDTVPTASRWTRSFDTKSIFRDTGEPISISLQEGLSSYISNTASTST